MANETMYGNDDDDADITMMMRAYVNMHWLLWHAFYREPVCPWK